MGCPASNYNPHETNKKFSKFLFRRDCYEVLDFYFVICVRNIIIIDNLNKV